MNVINIYNNIYYLTFSHKTNEIIKKQFADKVFKL